MIFFFYSFAISATATNLETSYTRIARQVSGIPISNTLIAFAKFSFSKSFALRERFRGYPAQNHGPPPNSTKQPNREWNT